MQRMRITLAFTFLAIGVMPWNASAGPNGLEADAMAIGITPHAIVAAGAYSAATTILKNLDAAQDLRRELHATRQRVMIANEKIEVLWQGLAQQPEDNDLLARQRTALHDAELARRELSASENALFMAAVRDVPASQVDRLRAWRENLDRNTPAEFRTVRRSGDEWANLEAALTAERRAQFGNQPVHTRHKRVLDDARSQVEVVQATVSLELHLREVELLFSDFSSGDRKVD